MNIRSMLLWIFIIAGCRNGGTVKEPLLLYFPRELYPDGPDSIALKTEDSPEKWTFVLLSQRQPAPLTAYVHDGICVVPLRPDRDFCQGPATFCCIHGPDRFFYPMRLTVRDTPSRHIIRKQYQDPKTVNPDSSLWQQRLFFDMDTGRNILPFPGHRPGMATPYFYHYFIRLSPQAGTVLVQPHSPISAVYVQPGTVSRISLQGSFSAPSSHYFLQAYDLKDKYGNPIADGTMVNILYRLQGPDDGDALFYSVETPVYQGRAAAFIPAGTSRGMYTYARIGTVESQEIHITAAR